MSESFQPDDRPKRRWYQFYLWHLFVLVAVVAIGCAWFRCKMVEADRQREVVEVIQGLGGRVHHDYQSDGDGGWLRNFLGPVLLGDVAEVRLDTPQINDDALAHLQELTNLRTLCLCDTQVTDAGLEHLWGLTTLENLWLDDTFVTDDGLVHLKRLTRLKSLGLSGTQVTDDGLMHLRGLTGLKELRLWSTLVTEDGVKELQQALPGCRVSHTRCPYTRCP